MVSLPLAFKMSGMKSRQLSTGFGLPAVVSELDGNLLGPVDASLDAGDVPEEEVAQEGEVEMLQYDLSCIISYMLSLFALDVDNAEDITDAGVDVLHDVGIDVLHGVGIVLEVDMVHDELGGWADLLAEDDDHLPVRDFVVGDADGDGGVPERNRKRPQGREPAPLQHGSRGEVLAEPPVRRAREGPLAYQHMHRGLQEHGGHRTQDEAQ